MKPPAPPISDDLDIHTVISAFREAGDELTASVQDPLHQALANMPSILHSARAAIEEARTKTRVRSRWPKIFNRLLRPQNQVNNALIQSTDQLYFALQHLIQAHAQSTEDLNQRIHALETVIKNAPPPPPTSF